MTIQERKDAARRLIGMWASNSPDRPEDIVSDRYVNHQEPDVMGGVSDKTLEDWKRLVHDFHQAFSDAKARVLMQVAERDLVATRWEFTATHTGAFMRIAPTSRQITWTGVQIDRFKGDKVVESWVDWDKYRFLEGLGAVK
jgi:predicted ester cyclase